MLEISTVVRDTYNHAFYRSDKFLMKTVHQTRYWGFIWLKGFHHLLVEINKQQVCA